MGERQFEPRVYAALKAETKRWIEKRFGYQKVAAGFTRVLQQAISDYCNPHTADFIAADVMLDLMRASGDVTLLDFMAAQLGYLVIPRPSVERSGAPLGRITGAAMKETADVFGRYGQMLEDGVLTSAEGSYLRREIREAIEALALMDLQIEAQAEGEADR